MTILVTGGLGFIGSHTVVELLENKYEVVVVDNLSNSKASVLDRIKTITNIPFKFYQLDLTNSNSLRRIFLENDIKSVMHFAGLKSVGESFTDPLIYYKNNIIGTLNLCEIMKEFKIQNLVFSSSATVYSELNKIPLTEDSSLNTKSPYGRTKLMMEEILTDLSISDKEWNIILLRYFNPIGAHPSGLLGEDPISIPNNLMPYISQVARGKLKELSVYGGDYSSSDGTGVRDFIHVIDVAKGHIAALEKINEIKGIEAFNLGTGKGYSVLEVVKAFEQVSGINIPYKIVERRTGDIEISYADVSKAYVQLGWKAKKNLLEMCQDTWKWQTMNIENSIK